MKETSHHVSQEDSKIHLRWLEPHLTKTPIHKITRDLVDDIAQVRKSEGVSNSTVNRMLEIIRTILRKAHYEWDCLKKLPKIRMYPKTDRRVRWITQEEAEILLYELPLHLSDMARFSLETGLRRSNVTHLEWSQVDIHRRFAWIHPDQAKAKKPIPVPLSIPAVQLLEKCKGNNSAYVFTYQGNPVIQTNTKAWRNALKRAGIENFRWHDLRHTWASWHVQKGTPLHVLKDLGGWSNYESVLRYAHLGGEHLLKYVDLATSYNQLPLL